MVFTCFPIPFQPSSIFISRVKWYTHFVESIKFVKKSLLVITGQIIPCLRTHGLKIRRAVWKEARLPVCVGIGATLTLAKVANHFAKKTRDLAGVCVIESDEFRNSILRTMKTSDVWGVGSRIAKQLAVMNIHTALELANMNPGLARLEFSIELERTVRELNGQECKSWDEVKAAKKQIFSTRSLGQRITNLQMLTEALSKYASIAAAKARSQGSVCSAMVVFASNSPFDEKPAGFKYFHHFSFPTNDTGQIVKVATQAATERFRSDIRYYKVGVGLIELSDAENLQSDLFEEQTNPAKMVLLDELNAKYGSDTLFMAAQGIEQKWSMRRDFLSPQFTSKWSDIPIIEC